MPTRSDFIREIEAVVALSEKERQGLRVINLFRLAEITEIVRRASGRDLSDHTEQLQEALGVIQAVREVVDAHRSSQVKSVKRLIAELDQVLS